MNNKTNDGETMNKKECEYEYVGCCVDLKGRDITEMCDCATEVSYQTVRKRLGEALMNFAASMGYETSPGGSKRGLFLSNDYHVRYYKSTYKGKPCYYIDHSCIEYVFIKKQSKKEKNNVKTR